MILETEFFLENSVSVTPYPSAWISKPSFNILYFSTTVIAINVILAPYIAPYCECTPSLELENL